MFCCFNAIGLDIRLCGKLLSDELGILIVLKLSVRKFSWRSDCTGTCRALCRGTLYEVVVQAGVMVAIALLTAVRVSAFPEEVCAEAVGTETFGSDRSVPTLW